MLGGASFSFYVLIYPSSKVSNTSSNSASNIAGVRILRAAETPIFKSLITLIAKLVDLMILMDGNYPDGVHI